MKVKWSADDEDILRETLINFTGAGFIELRPNGHYLVASYDKGNSFSDVAAHTGQLRISFEYDMCGPVTVVA